MGNKNSRKDGIMTEQMDKIRSTVEWPYRLFGNIFVLTFIWIFSIFIITIRHNIVGKQIDSLMNDLYTKTADVGWGVEDITIEGRLRTSKEDVLRVVELEKDENILEVDINKIRKKIEELPWVKRAIVSRRYFPNVIHISIVEKKVKSIWQYQEEFYPIDEDGKIIETEYIPQSDILQIIGEGAPDAINSLLSIIEQDKELFSRVKAANFISKRRWNLIFDDILTGVIVKMPEENIEDAWKKLIKLEKTKGLLKRKLTFIDLRLKNKVVVKIDNEEIEE